MEAAPFDLDVFGFSDFFAMAVDSLVVVALADELLAKSQDGGPLCCVDIRSGGRNACYCCAAADNGKEGEKPGGSESGGGLGYYRGGRERSVALEKKISGPLCAGYLIRTRAFTAYLIGA